MFVKIFKLGENEVVHTFPVGTHTIGRGPDLQCNDKRVSRNHATIEVTPDSVKLTSIHINPCFLKVANGKTITIVKKDSSAQLNNGDTFAFLPEDYWFKIELITDNSSENTPPKNEIPDSVETTKRPMSDTEDAPPDKKTKNNNNSVNDLESVTSHNDETGVNLIQVNSVIESHIKEEITKSQIKEEITESQIKEEVTESQIKEEVTEDNGTTCDANPSTSDEVTSAQGVEQEQATSSDKPDDPCSSVPKSRREKCWYAAECYRKSQIHRQEYKHPGDSDFESDPDDNRPSCSYGAGCYRKNKDHRRDYKHPPRQPPSEEKRKRKRKKVQRLNAANTEDMAALSDSESEDPFIADDDSDEYVGDSDEDDSDWEDSQNADEDSEVIKRLVKEANKFVKK